MTKRCCSCSNRVNSKDRISQLHNTIQSSILSFLPIEDATRTRFLSTKWRNIRPSIYNLSFNEQNLLAKNKNLNDFVKQVFLNVGSFDIGSFTLTLCAYKSSVSKRSFISWISFAVKHNVRIMDLGGKLPCIPPCISTCTTLTELKFSSVILEKLTPFPQFPVLKTLKLYDCAFWDENEINLLCSSSICPLLEDLTLTSCRITEEYEEFVNFSAPNLKFLCVDSWVGEIVISCPNLQQLSCKDNESINIDSDTLSNIHVARIGYGEYRTSNILMGLRNVVKLYFGIEFFDGLITDLCLPDSCCSLKYLEIDFVPGNQQQLDLLYHLFGSYPNLTTLSVNLKHSLYSVATGTATKYNSSAVDGCKKLKTVEIKNFTGSEKDLSFVRYVLGKADSMENMNIVYSRQTYVEANSQMQILKKLLGFARASPRAAVSLS